jgi:hypothetical protein
MLLAKALHQSARVRHQHVDDMRTLLPRIRRLRPEACRFEHAQAARRQRLHAIFDVLQANGLQEFSAVFQHAHAKKIGIAAFESMGDSNVIELTVGVGT